MGENLQGVSKEELVDFLKNNLRLSYKAPTNNYGHKSSAELTLTLEGEEISTVYIDFDEN